MLRELTRQDWLTMLGLDEQLIPETVILRGTRNLRRNFEKYRPLFANVHEIGSPNGLFEDVLVGRIDGCQVGYASVYGPAMASEIAHVFGLLGTRRIIQTGVCGGLVPSQTAGDLVIVSTAGCGEGAVACYLPGVDRINASPDLLRQALALAGEGGVHVGPIWTTAALLAEGVTDLTRWRDDGFIAVDLETASTFGVAEWAGMERVSILSIFDTPLAGAHLGLEDADKRALRDRGEQRMLEIVRALATLQ